MDLLISFLIALGIITSGTRITTQKVNTLTQQNHELLKATYGDRYLTIIGTDNTEKQ